MRSRLLVWTVALSLGAAGAWATAYAGPRVANTLFMIPAVTVGLAIITVGGFWPAFVASLLPWAAVIWYVLEPVHSFQVASGDDRLKVAIALLSVAAVSWVDGKSRRESARLKQRERELTDSEWRYRMLLDHASDAILVLSPTLQAETVNARAHELLGGSGAPLLGRSFAELFPAATDLATALQRDPNSAPRLVESIIARPDGTAFVGELSCRTLPDRRVQLIVRDVTQRVRATDEIRQERDLLDAILATSQAAIIALEMPSRRVLFANQRFAEDWSTTRAAVASEGVESLALEYAHPDGTPLPDGYLPSRRVAESGRVVHDERLLVRRPGGPWKLMSLSGAPLRSVEGRITAVVLSAVDVTEREATAAALAASEERLRRLTDAVPGAVYQYRRGVDGQRTFTFMSGGIREILNLPANAPVPSYATIWRTVIPEDRPRLERTEAASASIGSQWAEEFQIQLADGQRKWIRGTAVPEPPLPDGSIIWHGLLVDVTERKRLEDDVLQGQKMESIGRLAGGIAHDFNNILTAIRGNVDLLLEDISDEHPHVHELRDIRDAAQRATSLTRQLLAFSRKQAMQPRHIDLGALVRDVEKMLRRVIGEDVVLLTPPSEGLGTVRADPGQVEQVLVNLAVNARDAMPEGGLLTIETRNVSLDARTAGGLGIPGGDYVCLVVRDTGHGMDEATRARIFDPFFTTKPAGKGTGLGLAMVYGIVRQSGGAISVETEPGRGATFRIFFPRAAAPEGKGPDRITPTHVAALPVPEGTTVLLVEDDAAVRTLTRRILVEAGYQVRDAGDAYEALTHAGPSCDGLHAVVTDVIMPGLGGRDLARELRSRRSDLPILYISGYLDIDAQRLDLDHRTRLLVKPFTREALLRQLGILLDSGEPVLS